MKVSTKAPKWAEDLIEEVCKDYNRAMPADLHWNTNSKELHTSGRTMYARSRDGGFIMKRSKSGKFKKFRGAISITAGTDEKDQRLVLLHELAHWIVVRGRAMGHTVRFWNIAYELYERYGIKKEYAFEREKNYKQFAVVVYERRYKS